MERQGGVVTVEEIEHLLSQLNGVVSAKIVVNDWGAIEEIHVLATCERNPKQVVRDVESSLAARWGLNVDHKKISVAQITSSEIPATPLRLKPVTVEVATDALRNRIKARVVLSRTDDPSATYEGSAEAPLARSQAIRALCDATTAALNQALDPGYALAVEDVGVLRLTQREVLVVSLALLNPRGSEEVLIGAVNLKSDSADVAVKATLDAINRRIGRIAVRAGRPVSAQKNEAKPNAKSAPIKVGGEGQKEAAAAPAPD